MRTIAHISDLHFGAHDEAAISALADDITARRPSVVVVSGDLTQRARRIEFARARDYLASFGRPALVVPGNHDVPLFDIWRRFARPLARYRRYMGDDLAPFFVDDELAILGINTARSLTIKGGRVSLGQMDVIRRRFAEAGERRFKIVVTHHPFVPNPQHPAATVGRAARALAVIEQAGAQMLLTGHLHIAYNDVMPTHPTVTRSLLVVQAGTATSTRLRGKPNEYNFITIDLPRVHCQSRGFDGRAFAGIETAEYELSGGRWRRPEAERVST